MSGRYLDTRFWPVCITNAMSLRRSVLSRRRIGQDPELSQEPITKHLEMNAAPEVAIREVDLEIQAQLPLPEYGHSVGEHDGFVNIVGHQEGRWTVPLNEVVDKLLHSHPRKRIQGSERLVEQQEPGVAHKGSSKGHPLRLSAGQRLWPRPRVVCEADFGECSHRLLVAGSISRKPQHNVPPDTLRGDEAWLLEHHRPGFGHPDHTDINTVETGQNTKQSSLPSPGLTKNGYGLPGCNCEPKIVENYSLAESLGGSRHLDRRWTCPRHAHRADPTVARHGNSTFSRTRTIKSMRIPRIA